MARTLTIVRSDGMDAEEVDHPTTFSGECPACERTVRFTERQLVKNLRLFNLPLLAVEQGARVFQCPHCDACFEATDEVPDGTGQPATAAPAVDAQRITQLEEALTRTEDELSLWQLRVDLARRKGLDDLATEARALVDRYERAVAGIRSDLSRMRGGPATAAVPAPPEVPEVVVIPQPPAPPDKSPEPTPSEVDDEMASLKKMLRKRD